MAELILKFSEKLLIHFSKCRGQSYDNAANMAGKYNVVQQKNLDENKFAKFTPCASHSLNLVGRAAVDSCLDPVKFFGVVSELYCFFSVSTKRWAVLKNFLPLSRKFCNIYLTPDGKPIPELRQPSVKVILTLLKHSSNIYNDDTEKGGTKRQAQDLLQKIDEFEFAFMLRLWTALFKQFYTVSNALQSTRLH